MKIIIVIPAFQEATAIGPVIDNIQQYGYHHIIVVDDGSSDHTGHIARRQGAQVLTHRLNRGKGAAAKTGIEAAKILNADITVTMDGDGQHQAKDIKALVSPIIAGEVDVTLGSRRWRDTQIPRHKVITNQVGNALTWLIHRQWVADSQSGMRAYSRHAASLINTQANHYDYESEVIKEIHRHRLSFQEVPISVKYTAYSQSKPTKQTLTNGAKTAYQMIWRIIS